MQTVNQCLILAAGNGTRLRAVSHGIPKPLVYFQGKPILQHIMERAQEAGISKFVIVVGYRSDLIRGWLDACNLPGISITVVENTDYHKSNGVSALKASNKMDRRFLLLMADHVFAPQTAKNLMAQSLKDDEIMLAVDSNIDRVFDLADATKVWRRGNRIVDIGKEIEHYDALDTGMFLCAPVLFEKLSRAMKDGNCSLSDGMRQLARERKLRAFDIGEAQWEDLDTPEALFHAERSLDLAFASPVLNESLVYA
ncbi:MAG TPA: NTP transferase domain-containing protein [Terriglobales bacterium]|nr:NTP transferase domain-containing protein [Terriglobales bacterium]